MIDYTERNTGRIGVEKKSVARQTSWAQTVESSPWLMLAAGLLLMGALGCQPQSAGQKMEDKAEDAAHEMEQGMERTKENVGEAGEEMKEGMEEAGDKVKDATQ